MTRHNEDGSLDAGPTLSDRSSHPKITPRRLQFGPDKTDAALAEWYRSLAFLYETLESAEPDGLFYIDCTITQLPRACLMDCAGSALRMIRSGAYASRGPVDQVILFRLTQGRVVANYEWRDAVLEPGDLVFIDYQRARRSEASGFRCQNVVVPRDMAPARFRGGDLHGVRIAAANAAGRLLGRHMDALFDLTGEFAVDEADAAVNALFTLAAAVWREPDPRERRARDPVLDRAVAYIDANLRDVDLGPDELASALGIGRTTLYRAFASIGGVSAMILKRRLDASVLALVRNDPRPGLIKQIAAECGFRSSPQFTRAFRDRFGRRPGEVAALRAADVGGDLYTDWSDVRANVAGVDTVALWLNAQ